MVPTPLFRIRAARLPEDKPAILGFIMGLQRFERAIEPDRRVDPTVADEFYPLIVERVARRNGCILIAESPAGPVGWATAYEDDNEIYVHADERTHGYIAELYVVEEARGQGAGRALLEGCENWARGRGLKAMIVGALAGNRRAERIYRDVGFEPYVTLLRKYLR